MLGDQIKAPNKSLIIDQLSSFNSLNYLHIPHHQRQALFLSSSPRSSSHSYLTVRYILYSLNRQTSSSCICTSTYSSFSAHPPVIEHLSSVNNSYSFSHSAIHSGYA